MLCVSFVVTTKQKPIYTQKIRRKESKHTIKRVIKPQRKRPRKEGNSRTAKTPENN